MGTLVGLLRKRHRVVTIIKYTSEDIAPHVIALDFHANTKYAQPLIDKKIQEKQQHAKTPDQLSKPPEDANQLAITPIADELSKLAKLKEQGVITEEEFLKLKNNLIKGSKN